MVTPAKPPKTGSTCNVGFALRFCASRVQLSRGWLFEHVAPAPAFGTGEPAAQRCGKFTEIPHFAYKFVNLGAEKELRELQQRVR
jgi:hypothetical protein